MEKKERKRREEEGAKDKKLSHLLWELLVSQLLDEETRKDVEVK
jgi:hypothetical protein